MPDNVELVLAPSSSSPAEIPASATTKKKLARRTVPDRSQRVRLIVQSAFILLNVFLGAKFYFFVRYFETNGTGPHLSRPAGVDGWLPIAGLMNTRYFLGTGHIPAIHPAAMVLFLIFIAMSLLLKRAFCSWLCPVGTLSEYLWKAGRKLLGRNLVLPRWLDIPLRAIKYLLMAFFVVIIGNMTAIALDDFMAGPYGVLADVKMLHFFLRMSSTALIIVLMLVLLSVLIKNFWCRYACPYGAVMSLVSLASPTRIRRDEESCVSCGKCAKACPQNLPVDRLVQIRSAECTACMECVAICSAQNALQFALPPRSAAPIAQRWSGRALQPAVVVFVLAALFFSGIGLARITHHWQTNITDDIYRQILPQADELSHPGF
ncbi:MAG TPA: 4Fe-4S binding protein [Candidatus Saccharimonadales bacterium]|nr:4Fe-4S binding protein [Candidatus Saccharimonadales bacterium]